MLSLEPLRNIRLIVKHGKNKRGIARSVCDPVTAHQNPQTACTGERGIGPWRSQTCAWAACDSCLSLGQRGVQRTDRFRTPCSRNDFEVHEYRPTRGARKWSTLRYSVSLKRLYATLQHGMDFGRRHGLARIGLLLGFQQRCLHGGQRQRRGGAS